MIALLLSLAGAWALLIGSITRRGTPDWVFIAFWSVVLGWPLWLLGAPWWSTLPFAAWAAFMGLVVHGATGGDPEDC